MAQKSGILFYFAAEVWNLQLYKSSPNPNRLWDPSGVLTNAYKEFIPAKKRGRIV
jgi:hypothetical protein